jgi:hypothetical protein
MRRVAIRYVATADDISRLRFGVPPLGEAVFSIRMMASATERPAHQRWVRTWLLAPASIANPISRNSPASAIRTASSSSGHRTSG